MSLIFGKVESKKENGIVIKAQDHKTYFFEIIQFYDKNLNIIANQNIINTEVCFLNIDTKADQDHYNFERILNIKGKDYYALINYMASYKIQPKTVNMTEDEFKKMLKDNGTMTFDEWIGKQV